jgi:hypothetical protein
MLGPVRSLAHAQRPPPCPALQDIRGIIWSNGNSISLDNFYQQCSVGQASLDAANSIIMPVTIPCSGIASDGSGEWDTASCGYASWCSN